MLKNKQCIPCQGGVPPLEEVEKDTLLNQLHSRWELSTDKKRLSCSYETLDFKHSMDLANKIAVLADEQWHHPELVVAYQRVEVVIWTHKINDLVESDFIFAAKVDALLD
jgi:4a-hydroxytetrahydrobiopterin dehydratase